MADTVYYFVKTLDVVILTAVIFLCVVFGYIFVGNLFGMTVPKIGPVRMYIVLTGSMVPTFNPNDGILNIEVKPEDIKVGDIISFNAFDDQIVITHRVVAVDVSGGEYIFSTKGDNNNTADEFQTPQNEVIGKYIARIPRLGFYIDSIKAKPYLVLFPVALVIALQVLFSFFERQMKPERKTVSAAARLKPDAEVTALTEGQKPEEEAAAAVQQIPEKKTVAAVRQIPEKKTVAAVRQRPEKKVAEADARRKANRIPTVEDLEFQIDLNLILSQVPQDAGRIEEDE